MTHFLCLSQETHRPVYETQHCLFPSCLTVLSRLFSSITCVIRSLHEISSNSNTQRTHSGSIFFFFLLAAAYLRRQKLT